VFLKNKNMNEEKAKILTREALLVSRSNPEVWRDRMFASRYKYFALTSLFCLASFAFGVLGYFIQDKFYTVFYYYLWMGLCGLFFVLGIITWISYLSMIIRGKK